MRRLVRRALGHLGQGRRNLEQQLRERQLDTQRAQFGKIEIERGHRLHAHSRHQDIGGDKRIAVTVAANPAADAEENRQLPIVIRETRGQQILHLRIQTRQFGKEGILVVADTVLDFIDHGQTVRAQHARMPHA